MPVSKHRKPRLKHRHRPPPRSTTRPATIDLTTIERAIASGIQFPAAVILTVITIQGGLRATQDQLAGMCVRLCDLLDSPSPEQAIKGIPYNEIRELLRPLLTQPTFLESWTQAAASSEPLPA